MKDYYAPVEQMQKDLLTNSGIRKRMVELMVNNWQRTGHMKGMSQWMDYWRKARKKPRKK